MSQAVIWKPVVFDSTSHYTVEAVDLFFYKRLAGDENRNQRRDATGKLSLLPQSVSQGVFLLSSVRRTYELWQFHDLRWMNPSGFVLRMNCNECSDTFNLSSSVSQQVKT